MSTVPIILLKTKSSPTDPYDDYFRARKISGNISVDPIFVPVLKHRHVNLARLEQLFTSGKITSAPSDDSEYSGMIITSQRAVEAVGVVLDKIKDLPSTAVLLSTTKVYVVGPATRDAVVALGFAAENVLGQECGHGAVLSGFIREDYHRSFPTRHRPLLFLNNVLRGDVIPNKLAGSVELEELVVYETAVVDEFRGEFTKVMEETEGKKGRWVVVFSPTGADVALEVLREGMGKEAGTYWASIGPTTERHLLEKLGVRPDVVAKDPTPEGLWSGINKFMEAHS